MPNINDINGVTVANLSKLDAVLKANISKVNGLSFAAAFTGLLDTYTGAAAAYSTRRLYSLYTGAALRVRRDSDDTEQDIGFDSNGDLDTAAIASFVGIGNNGYVVTWYGQESSGSTGSGNDATQSTPSLQPQIYNGTAVYQSNGKPAIYVDPPSANVASKLELSSAVTIDSIFMVVQKQAITSPAPSQYFIVGNDPNNASIAIGGSFSSDALRMRDNSTGDFSGSTAVGTTQHLVSAFTDATTDALFLDGSSDGTGTVAPFTVSNIFNRKVSNDSNRFEGYCQEMIIWDTDQSSNRTGIESNINTYFSIY